MKCPYCGFIEDKVIDSRPTDEGSAIRRRRECSKCTARFTTYEKVESVPLMVIKKDKTRQSFDRQKLLSGLLRACEKRPVSVDALEKMVDEIEGQILNSLRREITTQELGELDPEKRTQNIKQMARIMYDEAGALFLSQRQFAVLYNKKIPKLSPTYDTSVYLWKVEKNA